jgi:programmed cell death 6-interacting protein
MNSRQQPQPEQQYQGQQPPAGYGSPNPFYNAQSPAPLARQHPVQTPVEARIQSWADNLEPQQPKPMPPAPPVWSPNMGIKFAQPTPSPSVPGTPQAGGQQGQGHGPAPGTWDPAKGIRFG